VPLLRTAGAEAFLILTPNEMIPMTTITTKTLQETLLSFANAKPSSLRSAVASEALEYDNPKTFFADLMCNGCISGMVGSLVYYSDTHAFFDQHYAEIEALRHDYEFNIGEPLEIQNDLKNFLAWFAFEETAFQMALMLGLEV